MNRLIALLALIKKEILTLFKDPESRITLFVPAFLQALLFGYAATYDLNHAPYALLDLSHSAESRALAAQIDGSPAFYRASTLSSSQDIATIIDQQQAVAVITIPSDFANKLAQRQTAPVQAITDGRNSVTAASAANYLANIIARYNQNALNNRPAIRLDTRAYYNPNLESRWTIMPALIAALSTIQTLIIAALSVAREREQGTFDQLLVTPLTPPIILLGKAIPAIGVSILQSTIVLLIIRLWFHIPMHGSYALLYLGLLSFSLAAVGLGLSISALTNTMQQAMLISFVLIMPMMLLSGLVTPVENMPDWLQPVTLINPLRYGVDLIRHVYLEGASLTQITPQLIALSIIAAVTLPPAAWLFRHRLG